jgi:flavin reductase (DIM6/NTAB) family NADH-FMN oxidoreductase RutF
LEDQIISIEPTQLSPRDAYRLMISIIVPRPIAWVSTIGADGSLNLAPFSFFNSVSGNPPILMFSVSRRRGQPKDTLRNIQETGEFVVNLADRSLAEVMVHTSGEWPYEVNEFEMAKLEMTPSTDVKPPRVAKAPVAMEAALSQIVPVEGSDSTMILGRIVRYHLRQGLLRANGLVDAALLQPLARLGGDEYATLAEIFSLQRPRVS